MQTSITTQGAYNADTGAWMVTRMTVVDQDDQIIIISLNENGSYDFSSQLIGDDSPVKIKFAEFEHCWAAIPELLGFV